MKQNSCQTSEGAVACAVDGSCGCAPTSSTISTPSTWWSKTRPGFMLALACLTSPCCTPLLVPLLLFLLAGSPVALWLTAYVGWVYGALTVVSLLSLGLAME